jgi:hypothetical protein
MKPPDLSPLVLESCGEPVARCPVTPLIQNELDIFDENNPTTRMGQIPIVAA